MPGISTVDDSGRGKRTQVNEIILSSKILQAARLRLVLKCTLSPMIDNDDNIPRVNFLKLDRVYYCNSFCLTETT